MTDDTEDVDPENPRPAGHYGRFRNAAWYYVSDELASTVMLGPATDAEPGDDWILSLSAEGRTEEDRERDTPPSATSAVNPSRSRKPSRTREANPYTAGVTSTPTVGRSG